VYEQETKIKISRSEPGVTFMISTTTTTTTKTTTMMMMMIMIIWKLRNKQKSYE